MDKNTQHGLSPTEITSNQEKSVDLHPAPTGSLQPDLATDSQRQHMITADGRVRYLDRREGALVWVYPQTGDIEVIPLAEKRGKLKRTWLAFVTLVLLFILGGAVLAVLGDTGVQSLNKTIEEAWKMASIFRIGLYALISWLVFPVIVNTARARAQNRMYARRYILFAEDPNGMAYSHALQQVEEQERKIARFRIPGWVCFVALMVFDVLVVQLPFLIK